VADVLHHEANEISLLKECARVWRRMVILKDHARDGLLAQARISLIDWAASSPYGVPCLYRYHSPSEWKAIFAEVGLDLTKKSTIHSACIHPAGNLPSAGDFNMLPSCWCATLRTIDQPRVIRSIQIAHET
jgi:hypothetical protein